MPVREELTVCILEEEVAAAVAAAVTVSRLYLRKRRHSDR